MSTQSTLAISSADKLATQAADRAHALLRGLVVLALVLAFSVILKGAYTRLVDAGLGCPDWPGCYGFVTVPVTTEQIALAESRYPAARVETAKGWPEMIHRYMAASLGLLILIIAGFCWRLRTRGAPHRLALALCGMVILQGAFGAWTVTLKLWPQVVTLHLIGGFATLSLLVLLYQRLPARRPVTVAMHRADEKHGLADPEVSSQIAGYRRWVAGAFCLVVVQVLLGGWLTSNYAALACPDFPTCQQRWWPESDFAQGFNLLQELGPNYLGGALDNAGRVAIHVSHRIGALITTLAILLMVWKLWTAVWLRSHLLLVLGMLATQILLGITNIVALVPLSVAVAHNGMAALLTVGLISLWQRLNNFNMSNRERIQS